MTNPPGTELQAALDRTQKWYEQTQNPLYVWEAITWCLQAEERQSLPDWCIDYLRDTATNLYRLSCGVDFREPGSSDREIVSSDEALKLVLNALSLSEQGKKNAFASLQVDQIDARSALDEIYYGPDECTARLVKRNITPKSARRHARRGMRLLDVKRKTSP